MEMVVKVTKVSHEGRKGRWREREREREREEELTALCLSSGRWASVFFEVSQVNHPPPPP